MPLRVIETNGRSIIASEPSPRRTATAILLGERIITPSMTAWPPTGRKGKETSLAPRVTRGVWRNENGSRPDDRSGRGADVESLGVGAGAGRLGRFAGCRGLFRGFLAVLLAEALNPAGLVDQLLLARIEGVAVRADVEVDLAVGRGRNDRGARLPFGVAAVAMEGANLVDGMNAGFHDLLLRAAFPGHEPHRVMECSSGPSAPPLACDERPRSMPQAPGTVKSPGSVRSARRWASAARRTSAAASPSWG